MSTLSHHVDGPVRVLQITDFHLFAEPRKRLLGVDTQSSFEAVLEFARERDWPPDLVLVTGDLAQDGSEEVYRRLHGYLAALDVPVYWLPGNHDQPAAVSRHLPGDGVKKERSICTGGWQVILLDSTTPGVVGGCLSEEELVNLDRCLRRKPDHYALVCLHHQPVEIGCDWMAPIGLQNPARFFEVVYRHPQVRGILWGHIHQDFTMRRKGLYLMGSPSTCFQFRPKSRTFAIDTRAPGYRWLELGGDGGIVTGVRRLENIETGVDFTSKGY